MRLAQELNEPMTGPSRDYHTMYGKEAQWRDEPHNINPMRAPVSMKLTRKTKTSKKPHYDLVPGRVPVLVRNSNINPAAEGTGDSTSEWNVSESMLGQEDHCASGRQRGMDVKQLPGENRDCERTGILHQVVVRPLHAPGPRG